MEPDLPVASLFQTRLSPNQSAALKRLGIISVRDLLYHFPTRYVDAGKLSSINSAQNGERVTVYGQVQKIGTKKSFRTRVPMGEATIRDPSGSIKLVWFHQPYMAKSLTPGDFVRASGIASRKRGGLSIVNPEIENVAALPGDIVPSLFSGAKDANARYPFFPVYPETRGITSRWIFHSIERAFARGAHERLTDPIPPEILKRYNLPSLGAALVWIHTPREEAHAVSAKKRFAFEEIFFIQLERQRARRAYEANPAFRVSVDRSDLDKFIRSFGFPLTGAQERAIGAILEDLSGTRPMLRLLEGDVGSGKTAVAAATSYAVVKTRPLGQDFGTLQVAYMCPTEILATQLFESFIRFFVSSGIQIGLITGSGCRKFPSKVRSDDWTNISRAQFLKWVANGEMPIVVGTHALIQKSVKFKHLAYVIIDEQHRFGTAQRAQLVQKDGKAPHFLSMTATPIPRTLALTLYGDLDLTLLDEMPAGRKPVETRMVSPSERESVYRHIREEIAAGRQAYVICPRIDEPDPAKELALQAKSVKEEARRLKSKVFPDLNIAMLHGKMQSKERDKVMGQFASGKIHILVATSVVEVGVNVPNATIILIEGAERFGLAQLHQLRGRVLRSAHQAHCYLFTESRGDKTLDRLKALATAKNGFELSEMDLALRGAGELGGGKQWGISDIGMEAIKNLKMVEAARTEAARILDKDPALAHHPRLREELARRETPKHFE